MAEPYYQDRSIAIHQGSALDVLRQMPSESIQCCVTSPPYWGLRDYGVEGQLGLEPSIELYIDHLIEIFAEVRRVLRSDGTCFLNIGDSYTSGGRSSHGPSKPDKNIVLHNAPRAPQPSGLKPKDLCLIPFRLALALQADGWWVRSDIIWAKPNPMPESATDRPTKAHEYVFLLSKGERYHYDAEAVRGKSTFEAGHRRRALTSPRALAMGREPSGNEKNGWVTETGFRNLRTVWEIPTHALKEAHFATFPPKLVETCLKAGTSERGACCECGAAWERVVEKDHVKHPHPPGKGGRQICEDGGRLSDTSCFRTGLIPTTTTTGWRPTCPCYPKGVEWREYRQNPKKDPAIDAENAVIAAIRAVLLKVYATYNTIPCVVLDPFAGAGTVGLVASRLSRQAILIELSPTYCAMIKERIVEDAPLFHQEVI